jgi:hypothetical protein
MRFSWHYTLQLLCGAGSYLYICMEKAHPEINELFIDWFQLFPVRVGGYSEK